MKKKASPIRGEWAHAYRIIRSIAKSCSAYNTWYAIDKDLTLWAAVDIGVNIQRLLETLPDVYASYYPTGYRVLFRGCDFDISYDNPLSIKSSIADDNRKKWQEFTQLFEEKAAVEYKRQRLFEIVATASDKAIDRIYNSATVWEAWDKRGI